MKVESVRFSENALEVVDSSMGLAKGVFMFEGGPQAIRGLLARPR